MTATEQPHLPSLCVPVEQHGSATSSDEVSVQQADPGGSVSTGVLSLRTRFRMGGLVMLLSRTGVELDGQSWELPWGQLRVPVVPGRHRLRVSFRYRGEDRGATTKEIDVKAGDTVEVRYRPPWLLFLSGTLRVIAEHERAPDEGSPIPLPAPAKSQAALAGWYPDPTDAHQRRWWEGDRWTQGSFRPLTTSYKVWVALLGVMMAVLAFVGGWVIGERLVGGADSRTESTAWVTVSDIEGVRFDMPGQPRLWTQPIPDTDITADVYVLEFNNMAMSATWFALDFPGDTRTDAQKLRDSAAGEAAAIDGTIVDARDVKVDGQPGLDTMITTSRDGGWSSLSRRVIDGDRLVMVNTVFDEDSRGTALTRHNRMADSITFTG